MENNKQYVEQIKKEYNDKEVTELDLIKKLDNKVKRGPMINAYTFGSISALILGVGMCICLKVLAAPLALGIVVGIIGLILVTVNPVIFNAFLKHNKKKYQKEMNLLCDRALNK